MLFKCRNEDRHGKEALTTTTTSVYRPFFQDNLGKPAPDR